MLRQIDIRGQLEEAQNWHTTNEMVKPVEHVIGYLCSWALGSKHYNKCMITLYPNGEVSGDYYDVEGNHTFHLHAIPDVESKTYSCHS